MGNKVSGAPVDDWASGTFTVDEFELEKGGVLSKVELAYIHTGKLALDAGNAILMTHGYTTGHHFVLPESLAAEGSWGELVGPGRSIDTDRYFVISTNVLGSCYGSSGPASMNPATGRPYGEQFPRVTLTDTVRLQRMLLESLGVTRLHAVAGPSMGGMQAFLWGIHFPNWVDRLVIAVSGIQSPVHGICDSNSLTKSIRSEPGWNQGEPNPGAMESWLVRLREQTLRTYSMDDYLREQGLAEEEVDQNLRDLSLRWAKGFHPWSLVLLEQAICAYDVAGHLDRIRAKVLLALCNNDRIYPASQGRETVRLLETANVRTKYVEISSRYGHLASGVDWQLWAADLSSFLEN